MSFLIQDHRLKVARLLRGDRRISDLNSVFADLRLTKPGRDSVREIGHFAAHRGERDKGVVLERAQGIQTSARLWVQQVNGIKPMIQDLRDAAAANLAIMPATRIKEKLGVTPQAARIMFRKAIGKLEAGRAPNLKEREVVNALGFSMTWQFAFDDHTLIQDLADLLVCEGALDTINTPALIEQRSFVALHALTLMHGASLKFPDGTLAPLRLAARHQTNTLRIKAQIPIPGSHKPTWSFVPLFETSLLSKDHCDPKLFETSYMRTPLEVEGDRIVPVA